MQADRVRKLVSEVVAGERVAALLPDAKLRAKTLVELANVVEFAIYDGPPPRSEKAEDLLRSPEAQALLRDLASLLSNVPWDKGSLEHMLRAYAEAKGVKLGQVAQPLRAALTGSTQSPPIDAVLAALGRMETMDRALAAVGDMKVG